VGMQNEKCCSTEADIWAGGMTMMKILAGECKQIEATEEVGCCFILPSYYILTVDRALLQIHYYE